ncbi:hypothetical protein A2U01_0076853, partial [Trifolium medium]|nr:hypothetical protein [Trifolium medium]
MNRSERRSTERDESARENEVARERIRKPFKILEG